HVIAWYLLCWNAVILDGPRRFVPQAIYQPYSQGHQERYVALTTLLPPIIFRTDDSPEWGISLLSLLSRQVIRLLDGDEPAFTSCGPSVSIRVLWPGYQPCHKLIPTRDYTTARRPITKAKLAKLLAKCIKTFMEGMSEKPMQVGSDLGWRIGPLDIKISDIILVSLHNVSQGSWQPQLRLRPSAANQPFSIAEHTGPQLHHNVLQHQQNQMGWPALYRPHRCPQAHR
ncbi:hypothetical protein BU15DRAFT_47946, partial [Melanogaster broomeanus]